MTFDDILEQVVTLLKRQGRVSYRALKMRLDIDDAYLDVLKEELLYVHPVVDDDGRGLLWTGASETKTEPVSTPPAPQEIPQEAQPTRVEPPLESRSLEAERRQLTVMFCDLVDSTKLSFQLDPEDYREVVYEYQRVCTEVIQRYDGHIAQLLGDGLLVYFGYPQAHEEDAHRAVYAGLGILDAMKALKTSLTRAQDVQLAIRLGIHTGLVVVGEMGGAGRQEQLALGEVPNVASRIQGMAQPDTAVMSANTYQLVQGFFVCEPLGEQDLRGVSQPIAIYRVLQESGVQSRLDVASTRGLTPLVGREQETGLLLERWAQVKDGQGQVILLSGEAGIGKSRLVQVLKEHLAKEPHTRWECRSSPYYQNTALYPISELLQRTLRWQQDNTSEERLQTLEQQLSQYRLPLADTIPLFAPLLSLSVPAERYPPPALSSQRQRQKTLETIVAILFELAEYQPVLFILEDLHWTDPTTLEFLDLLSERIPTAPILVLLTYRPTFQPPWSRRSCLTQMTLNRLSDRQIERMAERVAGGKSLPVQVLEQIVEKADGIPLFVEEMTKSVLESGVLKKTNDHYELIESLAALAIPATLQDSLMARLDRLKTAKGSAQLGAVLGRRFSYELLRAVSQLDEGRLQNELRKLVEGELLYQRGLPPQAIYTFKHALVVDAAYQSLLKSTRPQYHQRIAQVLEEQFPETVESQPELLAHHYTEAGLMAQAIPYWQRAGQRALERSAHLEAIGHLTKGIELLRTLPDTPERINQELYLQISLGSALFATKGLAAPEVEHVYSRARQLCQQVGDASALLPVLRGLSVWYMNRAQLQPARELAEQNLRLAQRQQDPTLIIGARITLGSILYHSGEFASAVTHIEQLLAFFASEGQRLAPPLHRQQSTVVIPLSHVDPLLRRQHPTVVIPLSHAAWALWVMGYADQALARSHEALGLAQELSQPFLLANAFYWAAQLHQFRRDRARTHELAAATIALSSEQGFAQQIGQGMLLRGWALATPGQAAVGLSHMRQGFAAWEETGAEVLRPYYLALLAEVSAYAGEVNAGLDMLDLALVAVDKSGERSWEAEVYRLKGELLLRQAGGTVVLSTATETAVACFQQAMAIARRQQAKSLELRAATSLTRLWQSQGKRQEAYDLLAPVYGWFTEGLDTADVQEAKTLLEALR